MNNKYKVIGLMSGTSLDGLDIAYCEFEKSINWKYKILYSETIPYSKSRKNKLVAAYTQNSVERNKTDKEYGKFIAQQVLKFIQRHTLNPDFISSHGHTILHQPEKGITVQIGAGNVIASYCKLPVIGDFRIGDVKLGGQGAPLVPLVDKVLFSDYTFCLNLGGFANVSFDRTKNRIAFDICPVNIVLNDLANILNKEFDKDGKIAAKGKINRDLLEALNQLSFYKNKPPKSLGREWVEREFIPVLDFYQISVKDKMRTVCEHIAEQVGRAINTRSKQKEKVLVTGGGAYNKFLIKRMRVYTNHQFVLPNDKTIQFKEAMAFAFLGVLRMRNEINILKSVTGAKRNSSGGKIFNS